MRRRVHAALPPAASARPRPRAPCRRSGRRTQPGHAAVVEQLDDPQAGVDIALDRSLATCLGVPCGDDREDASASTLDSMSTMRSRGSMAGVDVLMPAPVLAHRVLEADAAQHLGRHLQARAPSPAAPPGSRRARIVVADQADLDVARRDRHRVAPARSAESRTTVSFSAYSSGVHAPGRPPAVGVAADDVQHPRPVGADPDRGYGPRTARCRGGRGAGGRTGRRSRPGPSLSQSSRMTFSASSKRLDGLGEVEPVGHGVLGLAAARARG